MARFLVYTSPARGHLFPLIPTLAELMRRGHHVAIRTLASEVDLLRGMGFSAAPIAAAVEAREIDDWKARTPPGALLAACRTFTDRGHFEIEDLQRALAEEEPDALWVDVNSWGASATAEVSGLPWAVFAPYFLPVGGEGIPPWGLGLAREMGTLGRVRDAIGWRAVNALYDRALPQLNHVRRKAGATPHRHVSDYVRVPPRIIYFTAEPFEYPRAWPANVAMVGPGTWEPPATETAGTEVDERPLVLVTGSTEFQDDSLIVRATLAGCADRDVRVVATTGAVDPASFDVPRNARVERYIPHGPLLERAACVVCHGGMGITQKALAAGVPVCVIPFGRDQLEVARHVVAAAAGVRLLPKRATAPRVAAAIVEAIAAGEGARRVASAFRKAGGAPRAASLLEELVPGCAIECPPAHGERVG